MSETLSPYERIGKKKDFVFIYKRGRRYRGKYFTLIYLSNDLSFSRVAVVASKKIGNAVKRNKIKRRMRTLFRRNKHLLGSPLDFVFISRKEMRAATWPDLQSDFLAAVNAVGRRRQPV